MFASYAGSEAVCRYVGWSRHTSLDDTRNFLEFSNAEWARWPAGPYAITELSGEEILGSTGLAFESPVVASTGYVLAERYWGNGFASEALTAMVGLAADLGVQRVYALCHPRHKPSRRVLEKCAFHLEPNGVPTAFPNLEDGSHADAACYSRDPRGEGGQTASAAPTIA